MDCNQVFMVLTRGPFPTGEAWDEEVEAHLETCADCWRLADALRPALEVFQEAIPPSESRELPGYWGDARPAAAVVSELSRSVSRTAMSTRVHRMPRLYPTFHKYPIADTSSDTFRLRTAVLASAFAVTTIGFALLWWLW
jgi:hypothetical protein